LRRLRPTLVQGWMYHGNLAASLAALCAGLRAPVLWNVRGALDDPAAEPPLTRWVIRAGAALSTHPRAIIYNSAAAAGQHATAGYDSSRCRMIGNGFDLDALAPDPRAGQLLRQRLGLEPQALVVGIAAEVRPMKDHATLLAAIARLDAAEKTVHLVMLGNQADARNDALVRQIASLDLSHRVHLLGPLEDPRPVLKGLDLAVLSSAWGEGFPNAIGEAMAAEVPCVATDTGDCRAIIGDTGRVVPTRDPAALATALAELLSLPQESRRALGRRARLRIAAQFSIASVTAAYRALYVDCLRPSGIAAGIADEAQAA
jgi:glycosyltransferase involved in cell wall biosynthesis